MIWICDGFGQDLGENKTELNQIMDWDLNLKRSKGNVRNIFESMKSVPLLLAPLDTTINVDWADKVNLIQFCGDWFKS